VTSANFDFSGFYTTVTRRHRLHRVTEITIRAVVKEHIQVRSYFHRCRGDRIRAFTSVHGTVSQLIFISGTLTIRYFDWAIPIG